MRTRPIPAADPLTQSRLCQLDEDGFFITPPMFDEPTLESMRNEFHRLWQQHIARCQAAGQLDEVRYAQDRLLISQLDHASPICDAFIRHPAILKLVGDILGPDVDVTWNQAILKAPQRDKAPGAVVDNTFAWHQDMQYAVHGPYANDTNPEIFLPNDTSVTLWIPVTRATVDNGTLWVLPGRHKEGLLPHRRTGNPIQGEWAGDYDTSWRIPAVMKPGQILAFRKYLPHGSGQNVSSEPRMAYQLGYGLPGLKSKPSKDIAPVLRDGKPTR